MGAFKNEKNGTWYVQFRYTDWQGLRQQKLKRGFATKREAQEWERAFLIEKKADVTMPFNVCISAISLKASTSPLMLSNLNLPVGKKTLPCPFPYKSICLYDIKITPYENIISQGGR